MEQYTLHPDIPLPEPEWMVGMLQNDKEQFSSNSLSMEGNDE